MPAKFASLHGGLLARKGEAKPALASSAVWTLIDDKASRDEASGNKTKPVRAKPPAPQVDTPPPVHDEENRAVEPLAAEQAGRDEASSNEARPVVAEPPAPQVDTPPPVQGEEDGTIRLTADEVGGDEASSNEAQPVLAEPPAPQVDTPPPVHDEENRAVEPLVAEQVGRDEASDEQLAAMPMNGGAHATSSTVADVMAVGSVDDVIVAATGEGFSRSEIELRIANDPLFEHAIVMGNDRSFVKILAVLNASAWIELATARGIDPDNPNTRDAETALIERIRSATSDLPSYCQVRRVQATFERPRRANIIAANPAKGTHEAESQRQNNGLTLDQLRAAAGVAAQSGYGQLRRVFRATLDRLH